MAATSSVSTDSTKQVRPDAFEDVTYLEASPVGRCSEDRGDTSTYRSARGNVRPGDTGGSSSARRDANLLFYLGSIFVTLLPWIPIPAISPFWPKMKA